MTKREELPVIKEYWLLDLDEKKDVPASVRDKVVLKSVSAPGNPFKTVHSPVKTVRNPQSKVKESKGLKDLKEHKDLNDDDVNNAHAQAQPGCGKVESHVENLKTKAVENLFRKYFDRMPNKGELEICSGLLIGKDKDLVVACD